jgi:hypothetical protein
VKRVAKVLTAKAAPDLMTGERGIPGLQRPARALLGWMHADAAVLVLNSNEQVQGTPEQLEIVRRSAAAVASRDEGVDQVGVIEDPPPTLASYIEALRANSAAMVYFAQGFKVQIALLDRICSFQPVIFTDSAASRVGTHDADDLVGIAEVSLPRTQPQAIRAQYDPLRKSWIIASANPNLRILTQVMLRLSNAPDGSLRLDPNGVPVLGFGVAIGESFMQVGRFQGRYYLRDGYHRALGFLLRGITRVPVFVRDVPVSESLAPAGMLPEQSYLGSRPPQLRDYLDDDVSRDVTLPASQKLIVIEGLELSLAS